MSENPSAYWDASWLALLSCPYCKGSLIARDDQDMLCKVCSRTYPILSRVPALLPQATLAERKTQKLYGDIWESFRTEKTHGGYRAPAASHLDLLRMASGHELVAGKIGIDAGCGDGQGLLKLGRRHPQVSFIGLDLTQAIRKAAQEARAVPNVRYIQGNLLSLPLAEQSFDFIYSFGVLHHTSDPRAAFIALVKRLRPGGRITIFVYKDFSDLKWKRRLLKPVTMVRHVTTRLPAPVLRIMAWTGAPLVFLFLTLPARICRALGFMRLTRHIPYGTFPGLQGIAASLEDRFGAPYEHRFRIADLEAWAQESKLEEVRAVDCLPWGFSGLVLSGRVPGPTK